METVTIDAELWERVANLAWQYKDNADSDCGLQPGDLDDVSPDPSRRAAVDTESVMAAVESYGLANHDRAIAVTRGDYIKARDGLDNIEKLFAAIRAMLEPHDAARMRTNILSAVSDALVSHAATNKDYLPVVEVTNAVIRAIGGAE